MRGMRHHEMPKNANEQAGFEDSDDTSASQATNRCCESVFDTGQTDGRRGSYY